MEIESSLHFFLVEIFPSRMLVIVCVRERESAYQCLMRVLKIVVSACVSVCERERSVNQHNGTLRDVLR